MLFYHKKAQKSHFLTFAYSPIYYFCKKSQTRIIKIDLRMGKLFRSSSDKVLGGVCAGVAEFFGLDTKLVRLVWLVAALLGVGALLYVILWLIVPSK